MTERTWQDNADEFGRLKDSTDEFGRLMIDQQGVPLHVRLGLLVACSAERRPNGRSEKASMTAFSRRAHVGGQRVAHYLDMWNECAAVGLCDSSDTLTPNDVSSDGVKVPSDMQWDDIWTQLLMKRIVRKLGERMRNGDRAAARILTSHIDFVKTSLMEIDEEL